MGRLEQDQPRQQSVPPFLNKRRSTINLGQPANISSQPDAPMQAPTRKRWIPIWVWLLLPFVVMLLGGWWIYQSLVVRNLSFETKRTIGTGASVVESVRRVNKQIFVEHYEVVDIDYKEAPKNWLAYLGVEQSFVLLLRGNVPAGVDVTKIELQNVWISPDGRGVQLRLPAPQIFEENVSIDFDRSRILAVKDTCPDLICESDVSAYQNQLLPEGKQLLIDDAIESGILLQVADDAKAYYQELLRSLGFEEVQVVVTGY